MMFGDYYKKHSNAQIEEYRDIQNTVHSKTCEKFCTYSNMSLPETRH